MEKGRPHSSNDDKQQVDKKNNRSATRIEKEGETQTNIKMERQYCTTERTALAQIYLETKQWPGAMQSQELVARILVNQRRCNPFGTQVKRLVIILVLCILHE
ncbi:hypothetical protein PoB_000343600 [Plakobranchus ocellatus]|uniref:Uncharacterized protein n=1 Tax=Plakobranchus ocellatus TaxID=259542 RepID=A0AAV3Y3D8_9GAST|nr:hypothetical protein PoB_000343600 [Plakobranchus ocellatus]